MEYTSPEYTLIIGACRPQYQKARVEDENREIVIKIDTLLLPYFDHLTLTKITNTVVSLLYPDLKRKAPGTETVLSIAVLNKPTVHRDENGKEVERELLENGLIHGKVIHRHCTYSESGNFLSFDLLLHFFIQGGKVATGRMQVHPSSDKHLPLFF